MLSAPEMLHCLLGYCAALRILPDSTYFTFTNDSRNQAQVIDGGWSADYSSADDFIGKLTCRYFVPATGRPPPTPANSATRPSTGKYRAPPSGRPPPPWPPTRSGLGSIAG